MFARVKAWWTRLIRKPTCPICKRRAALYRLAGLAPMCARCVLARSVLLDRENAQMRVRLVTDCCRDHRCQSRKR